MIAFTKPVLIAAVAGVVALGAIASAAWRLLEAEQAGVRTASAPAPAIASAPPPAASAAPAAAPPAASAPAADAPAPPAAKAAPALALVKPTFDVVRIDPNGDAVVAGRAAPGARVSLLVSGRAVVDGRADADGQFVLLPPRLPEGAHMLALRSEGQGGEVLSDQTVAVDVAARAERPAMAALAAPEKPTVVLSAPAAAPAAAKVAPAALRIATVEAHQGGAFFVSGVAASGSDIRLYLNESYVAAVTAGQDGAWSVKVERGMSPGAYRVRADAVGADGKPVSRVETMFDYPASVAGAPTSAVASAPEAKDAAPQNAVVGDLRTARVARGDSLWRISRSVYGEGMRYTEIYDANAKQIRDPDLIYPGQVLVVPKQDQPAPARR